MFYHIKHGNNNELNKYSYGGPITRSLYFDQLDRLKLISRKEKQNKIGVTLVTKAYQYYVEKMKSHSVSHNPLVHFKIPKAVISLGFKSTIKGQYP